MSERPQWFRLEGESPKAYEAFQHYLFMDSSIRTIDRAWRAARGQQDSSKRAPGAWTEWSSQNNWVARATAYDDHLTAQRFIAEQDEIVSRARKLALERDGHNTRIKELSQGLLGKAEEMLKWPVSRKRVEAQHEDGKPHITIIEPTKWKPSTIANYIQVADKVIRLSLGMHTDATRVDVNQVMDDAVQYFLGVAERTLEPEDYERLANALE
jgi:hypothetical protein